MQIKHNQDQLLTNVHLATLKLFNTIQFVAVSPVDSSHIITTFLALAEPNVVKRSPNILVITLLVSVWKSVWLAAFSRFYVM